MLQQFNSGNVIYISLKYVYPLCCTVGEQKERSARPPGQLSPAPASWSARSGWQLLRQLAAACWARLFPPVTTTWSRAWSTTAVWMTCALAEARYPAVFVLFSPPTLTGAVLRYQHSTFFANIEDENHTNKLNVVNESVKGGPFFKWNLRNVGLISILCFFRSFIWGNGNFCQAKFVKKHFFLTGS
jgi:hypothetical protein